MTQKELNAVLALQCKIKRLQGRLDDLRQIGGIAAHNVTAAVMGGSGEFAVQIAAELEQEITGLQKQLGIEQVIIGRHIEKLALTEVEHKLMVLRYVEGRPWKVVGATLGYSERRIYQIHKRAKKIAVDCS